jgi:small subunit ribosomal protein S1
LELQQAPSDERGWWAAQDEGYWRALLEQGEIAPEVSSQTDPREILVGLGLESGIDTAAFGSDPEEDSERIAEDRWQEAKLALQRGDLFSLRASGANRGGLLVEWNGLQGFVPASHLADMPRHLDADARAFELEGRIGDSMTVCLIEVEPQQSQLVFSERAAVQPAQAPADILNRLQPGDVCQGTVTNLTTFGAFVDLGGVEGLIHISELSWERVRHPSDVLQPGQAVEVHVLGVNPDEERIALSLKRMRPDPWKRAAARYHPGQVVRGTVTNVVSFGAFVRIEDGLEGLVHVSELAEGSLLHPRNVVHEGDVIQVRILNVNPAKHRMGLSLRQAHRPEHTASY